MQCPRCKLYNVETKERKVAPSIAGILGVIGLTLVIWLAGSVVVGIIGWTPSMVYGFNAQSTTSVLWTILCALGGFCGVVLCLKSETAQFSNQIIGYSYYCKQCGYSWHT